MCFEVLTSEATHTREQAKIDAARVTQKARNELLGAQATQNAWVQSYSNQRRVKAAGKQADEITANIGRNLDAATYGRLGERLAASEELGANMASAAAAGGCVRGLPHGTRTGRGGSVATRERRRSGRSRGASGCSPVVCACGKCAAPLVTGRRWA